MFIYEELGLEKLDEMLELWNRNIGVVYPMDKRLFEQNLSADRNWKKIIGAYDGDLLAGFVIIKQWTHPSGVILPKTTSGNINSLIVDMNYRRHSVGSKLLNLAEEELRLRGVKNLSIGGDYFHFFPGVPMEALSLEKFLINRGYNVSDTYYDVICDLSQVEFEKLPGTDLNNDYIVEELQERDKDELFRFLERCFSGRWNGDTRASFELGMECRDIVVTKDEDKVVGFAHIYDDKSKVLGPPVYWRGLLGDSWGGLGPIGIDSDYRGKGLGVTLLYKSLEILKTRGIKNTGIDWTDLTDFYRIFNYVPWKQYKRATKEL